MQDDRTFNVNQLTRLQRELAAIVRQYRRAVEAHDSHAQEIETQAICNRIRCLLYHHLDLRMGMSSENWVWLNAADDDCEVQRCGSAELR